MANCQSLPGIVQIGYIRCQLLQEDIVYRAAVGIKVELSSQPTDINFMGDALCETEEEFNNNIQLQKTKLSFQTLQHLPTNHPLAFVIRTVEDERYVIGSQERPYPTVKVTRSTGQPDGDPSVRKYEVSFTARKSLALCSG